MDSAVSTASGEMLYRDLDREGLAPLWTRLICRTVLRERLTIAGKLLTTEQARHHAELDWHDRGNERSEPISIDGLDLHMVNLFDASFFEHDLNGGVPQVRPITIARFATAGRAADRELRAALELVPLDVVLRAIRNETDKPLCPVNAPATPWREPCLLKAIVERCCRFLLVPGRVDGWSKVNHEGATGARQCAGAFGR
jgi:hypothetical protein